MCYAAVNNDDVKDLGRQKEGKKKFLVSFSSLPFPFLISCSRYITSLMLPVYKKNRIFQLSSQQWISWGGGGDGAPATCGRVQGTATWAAKQI